MPHNHFAHFLLCIIICTLVTDIFHKVLNPSAIGIIVESHATAQLNNT